MGAKFEGEKIIDKGHGAEYSICRKSNSNYEKIEKDFLFDKSASDILLESIAYRRV